MGKTSAYPPAIATFSFFINLPRQLECPGTGLVTIIHLEALKRKRYQENHGS